jgi:hypothetical protein
VYDPDRDGGRIFFYDVSGARFETPEYGAAGSGSERIRGVFDYITKTRGPFSQRPLEEALREAILLLDIAADLDAATGGIDKVLPTARYVNREGRVRSARSDHPRHRAVDSQRRQRLMLTPYDFQENLQQRAQYIRNRLRAGSPVNRD